MNAAPDLNDFVRFAVRQPVMIALQVNMGEVPGFFMEDPARKPAPGNLFDADATRILNRETPFRLLEEAAVNEPLPPELHREALMTAFTRGLMLGEDLSHIARKLGEAVPDLAPLTGAYLAETSDEGRRFAAAFLLLHRPEARPYFAVGITRQSQPGKLNPYRDNWWCPMDVEGALDTRANYMFYDRPPAPLHEAAAGIAPEFLGGSAAADAKREMDRLERLGAATDFLAGIVFPYAKTHPGDARIPEALYWLVRAGHYGCADVNTWKSTRAAFELLQLSYPKTTWARRTPTWFKNDYVIRQELKDRQ